MKLLVALVLFAQLLSCKAKPLPNGLAFRSVNCDDVEAEEVAQVAVNHINSHSLHGFKFTVNVIEDIEVLPRRPSGEVMCVKLKLLETECPVISPVPVENCTVRQQTDHAVEGECEVRLLKLEGKYNVLNVKCHSSPDSVEDIRKYCPKCPVLQILSDAGVVHAVNVALAKFNTDSATRQYKVLEISRALHSDSPDGFHVEFAIAGTNCTAEEAKEHPENCHVETGNHAHFGFCKASVIKTPIVPADAQGPAETIDVICEIYEHQPGPSHTHLTEHHLGGNRPSPGVGFTVLDLVHSHNNTLESHESHSAEVLVPAAAPVVKRAAATAEPQTAAPRGPFPVCPGKTRHFHI